MFQEIKIKEVLNKRLYERLVNNQEELKCMYNLIKVPRLCDEYHKAERRKYYSDKKEMINEEVDTMNAL